MRTIISLFILPLFLFSCSNSIKQDQKNQKNEEVSYKEVLKTIKSDIHQVKALESVTKGSYTYVKLQEGNKEFWAAISAQPIEIGSTYYYKDALEMTNFESKSLNKVFASIWFINDFYAQEPIKTETASNHQGDHQNRRQQNTNVESINGIQTLADIFKNKEKLQNKLIRVKGKVVKINPNIMNRNWIHIQDGTSYQGFSDLAITSTEDVDFNLGDNITFQGILILNKDFGSGYRYDFLLENATKE